LIEHGIVGASYFASVINYFCASCFTESDIAPLRDSNTRSLVAMMTPQDFVVALQICRQHNIPVAELATKTIADMLASPILRFKHTEFHAVDPEDSACQLYFLLQRTNTDFSPVVDPETGHLVAVLGYFSMLYLLHEACKQHSKYFFQTIDHIGVFDNFVTAPISTRLEVVLMALEQRNLLAIPVTDLSGRVVGLYYRTDANFSTRSQDPVVALRNLADMSVGDALALQQKQSAEGGLPVPPASGGMPPAQGVPDPIPIPREFQTVRCALKDNVMKVVGMLMTARTLIAVVVDDNGFCLGTVTVMDILKYYFSNGPNGTRMDH
jgi:CBS domain-containing protein